MKEKGYLLMLCTALLTILEVYMGLHLNEALLILGLFFVSFSITRVRHLPDLLLKKNIFFILGSIFLLAAYILIFIEGFPSHRVYKYPGFFVHIFIDLLYFAVLLSPLKSNRYIFTSTSILYVLSQAVLMFFEINDLIWFVSASHQLFNIAFKIIYVLLWDILRIAIISICLKFALSQKKIVRKTR
jgi:hypothetical protein